VRIAAAGSDAITLAAADATGQPVVAVESLALRPVSAAQLAAAAVAGRADALFYLDWTPLDAVDAAEATDAPDTSRWAILGPDPEGLGAAAGLGSHPDLAALAEAAEAAEAVPELLLVLLTPPAPGAGTDTVRFDPAFAGLVHDSTARQLDLVQSWLGDERWSGSRLAVITRGAVATRPGEDTADLVHSGIWGLVRTAQSENPDRFVLIDLDPEPDSTSPATTNQTAANTTVSAPSLPTAAIAALLAAAEPQAALRDGVLLVPRLAHAASDRLLIPPRTPAWRLDTVGAGTLENLALLPFPQAAAPLEPGQVRIAVRAAGLNFKDVLGALGMYPGEVFLGNEGAGVVIETGPETPGFAVGDRVAGMIPGGFGPIAVADRRMLTPIPDGWSFAQAAAVPVAYTTAYYGLRDLGLLEPGQRVLIHAAAGGVGMAAVRLARHFGAEVFVTASPGKWDAVRALGIPEERISSSRDLDFERRVLEATDGAGVDVVLDSLAREFVDASLRLLPRGGRFVEMGRIDVRDPEKVAADHPGVIYRAFDLVEAGPKRIGAILAEVVGLLERGVFEPHPIRVWDVRRAPEAFRFMSQARQVGKLVLTMPAPVDPEGTALITGGTGTLGGLLARHLVAGHGVRNLVLASRGGDQSPGVASLLRELTELGARVTVEACDAADRTALAGVLAAIPAEHPLTAVVHAAAVLDDGVLSALDHDRLWRVLRPKVDAAVNLHDLTLGHDLAMFALFSSASGVFGTPGQANYAAANTFLDALAARRRAHGLPATSLAWGYWARTSALTGHLDAGDVSRMNRGGALPLSSDQGLALFDTATGLDRALQVPIRLDLAGLRAAAGSGPVPPLYRALVRTVARRAADSGAAEAAAFAGRLARLPEGERFPAVLDLVRRHVATVLGHARPQAVDADRGFVELGFDSLTAVELRNRLNAACGLRLPATAVFDYPTTAALADYLLAELAPGGGGGDTTTVAIGEDELRRAVSAIPLATLREAGMLDQLLSLAGFGPAEQPADPGADGGAAALDSIAGMDADELIELALGRQDG
jgi:NADPH:quinone reductase-like Zn-dependent oxidoreductase/acyl carrier protein/NADP-dependent 3-hydroxy acid dehydrogenase YdfG